MKQCDDHVKYSKKRKKLIQIIYIISVILWILVVYALRVYHFRSPVGYIILAIPIFVYAIGFLSVYKLGQRSHRSMLKNDILPIAILFVGALFNGHPKDPVLTNMIVVAALLVVLSFVDIWGSEKDFILSRIIKSIIHTAAITLLVFVMYIKYTISH